MDPCDKHGDDGGQGQQEYTLIPSLRYLGHSLAGCGVVPRLARLGRNQMRPALAVVFVFGLNG